MIVKIERQELSEARRKDAKGLDGFYPIELTCSCGRTVAPGRRKTAKFMKITEGLTHVGSQ